MPRRRPARLNASIVTGKTNGGSPLARTSCSIGRVCRGFAGHKLTPHIAIDDQQVGPARNGAKVQAVESPDRVNVASGVLRHGVAGSRRISAVLQN